jgi:hypothetical protein
VGSDTRVQFSVNWHLGSRRSRISAIHIFQILVKPFLQVGV